MSPQLQLRWTIVAALLMWSPAGFAVVFNHGDVLRSGVLFVGALILAYIGTSIIAYLINSYAATQDMVAKAQRQIEDLERRNAERSEAEGLAEGDERRRTDD